jgi:hypothetical protein
MEDIILKLQQKERKFKVTVKKKFVEDALYNSTSLRVASVYVIVINREKNFDLAAARLYQKQKRLISKEERNKILGAEDSSEDEVTP